MLRYQAYPADLGLFTPPPSPEPGVEFFFYATAPGYHRLRVENYEEDYNEILEDMEQAVRSRRFTRNFTKLIIDYRFFVARLKRHHGNTSDAAWAWSVFFSSLPCLEEVQFIGESGSTKILGESGWDRAEMEHMFRVDHIKGWRMNLAEFFNFQISPFELDRMPPTISYEHPDLRVYRHTATRIMTYAEQQTAARRQDELQRAIDSHNAFDFPELYYA